MSSEKNFGYDVLFDKMYILLADFINEQNVECGGANRLKAFHDVSDFIKRQIELCPGIDAPAYIRCVFEKLKNRHSLNIYGCGNPIMDEAQRYNVFDLLRTMYNDSKPKVGHFEILNNIPGSQRITEREKKYFDKAIEKKMAQESDNGYKWLYERGSKASLAYFLYKIFNTDRMRQIPFKRLGVLWGVSRLDSALGQALDAKKPQQWRTDIDKLFTE